MTECAACETNRAVICADCYEASQRENAELSAEVAFRESVRTMLIEEREAWHRRANELSAEVERLRAILADIIDFEFRIPAYKQATWPRIHRYSQRMIIAVGIIREYAHAALAEQATGDRPEGKASEG